MEIDAARRLVREHEDRNRRAEPEARRAEGRYYTPEVLVRWLCARVLDPLVARADSGARTPAEACEQIHALRVLDPSVGAGAFLLGALEHLTAALVRRGARPEQAAARLVEESLLGLDVDAAAVETARRALELAGRAPCPGVVVGDALEGPALGRFGRLDAVLGNPPYLREKDARPVLERARSTPVGRRHGAGRMDLWYLFAHAALEALPEGGRHGFVVPAYWQDAASARHLREHLRRDARLEVLLDLGARPFFKDVTGRHVVYACERAGPAAPRGALERIELLPPDEGEPPLEPALLLGAAHPRVVVSRLEDAFRADGTVARGGPLDAPAARVEATGVPDPSVAVGEGATPGPEAWTRGVARRAALALGEPDPEALERARGIAPGEGVFVVPEGFASRPDLSPEERAALLPWAAPVEVPAFPARPVATHRIVVLDGASAPRCPRLLAHLERFRPALDRRRETALGRRAWFELHWPRERALFEGPRVLLPRMVDRPRAAYVEEPLVVGESVLVLRFASAERARLAAALLNAEPLRAWLLARGKRRGVGVDVSVALARQLPWPRALVDGRLAEVEPVARALEAGRPETADAAAWRLYDPADAPPSLSTAPQKKVTYRRTSTGQRKEAEIAEETRRET